MGKLKIELENLERNIRKTDDYMSQLNNEFWADGGICCPMCGMPLYRVLHNKQENRYKRRTEILKKLADSTKCSRPT